MAGKPDAKRGFSLARLALLTLGGILLASVLAEQVFARDQALGIDELWVILGGLGFAVLVEFGVLARRRS